MEDLNGEKNVESGLLLPPAPVAVQTPSDDGPPQTSYQQWNKTCVRMTTETGFWWSLNWFLMVVGFTGLGTASRRNCATMVNIGQTSLAQTNFGQNQVWPCEVWPKPTCENSDPNNFGQTGPHQASHPWPPSTDRRTDPPRRQTDRPAATGPTARRRRTAAYRPTAQNFALFFFPSPPQFFGGVFFSGRGLQMCTFGLFDPSPFF